MTEDYKEKLINKNYIEDVGSFGSSIISVNSKSDKENNKKVDAALLGIQSDDFYIPKVIEGKKLNFKNKEEVVINDSMKREGYNIGDTLKVSNSDKTLKIVGFVKNETYNHLPSVFTSMDNWRDIQYAAPNSNNSIKKPIQALMVKAPSVENPSIINDSLKNTETVKKDEAVKEMPGYKEENGTITMMLGFCLTISTFIIAVFFYVITMQKKVLLQSKKI